MALSFRPFGVPLVDAWTKVVLSPPFAHPPSPSPRPSSPCFCRRSSSPPPLPPQKVLLVGQRLDTPEGHVRLRQADLRPRQARARRGTSVPVPRHRLLRQSAGGVLRARPPPGPPVDRRPVPVGDGGPALRQRRLRLRDAVEGLRRRRSRGRVLPVGGFGDRRRGVPRAAVRGGERAGGGSAVRRLRSGGDVRESSEAIWIPRGVRHRRVMTGDWGDESNIVVFSSCVAY